MIYQYAPPLALPQCRNLRIGGEVIYPTHAVRIPRRALPNRFTQDLGVLIRRLAADTPPSPVPSVDDCRQNWPSNQLSAWWRGPIDYGGRTLAVANFLPSLKSGRANLPR